jgi:tryptophan-rich sensory protein
VGTSLAVLAGLLLASFAVAAIGGVATASSVDGWYRTLTLPAFTPPDWVFAPAWTALYVMMAVAAWRVWQARGFARNRRAMILYFSQLALNAAWPVLFFGLMMITGALVAIVALLFVVGATTLVFWQIDRPAGFLFVPYLMWVGFATALNGAIWYLNAG